MSNIMANFARRNVRPVMEYKRHYEPEEIAELRAWFAARIDRLPEAIHYSPGTEMPELRRTVEVYLDICARHADNPTYSTQIYQLFRIRERLIEEGYFA